MQKIFIDYASGPDGEAATRIGETAAAAMPAGWPAETRGILWGGRKNRAMMRSFGFIAESRSDAQRGRNYEAEPFSGRWNGD
jgi:hypothetical protein